MGLLGLGLVLVGFFGMDPSGAGGVFAGTGEGPSDKGCTHEHSACSHTHVEALYNLLGEQVGNKLGEQPSEAKAKAPADDPLRSGIKPYAVTKVVIDPGHGGHDHGCSGKHSREKHVALEIALKVGGYIEEHLPDVEVIYTRKTDVFVELHERAAIANRAQADVFISIHCNANTNPRPYGTETYVMGLHRNEANLKVAKRENAVITMEDDYNHHYDGFDPNDPSAHIIFTLFQGAHLEQSIELAGRIEEQFAERVGRKSRGVKQAGFLVLYKTTMPAVLIETGFLTNTGEENFLTSEQGKTYMASAIYRAFRDYKIHTETKARIDPESIPEVPLASGESAPQPETAAAAPKPEVQSVAEAQAKAQAQAPAEAQTKAVEAEASSPATANVVVVDKPTLPTPAEQAAEDAAATPEAFAEQAKPAPSESLEASADAAETAPIPSAPAAATQMDTQETVYRVQVYASHRKCKSTDPLFKPLTGEDLYRAQEGNLYKYMVGGFADRDSAVAKQAELRERGYEDCFIVTQEIAVLAAQ
jgi:N-acetylmuramoyl-L-alanine amidase